MKIEFVYDLYGEKMMTFILNGDRILNFSTDLNHKYTRNGGVPAGFPISYRRGTVKLMR